MKHPSAYLRMRILGAIDLAPGASIRERIKAVSNATFTDELGNQRTFTWRTISTWLYRFKLNGVTAIQTAPRSDKGKTRKITPEQLLEAINQVLPFFRARPRYNKSDVYRRCIELGLLRKEEIAWTTFYRLIREYELLKDDPGQNNKLRLAFAMQFANQLWQADTMYGPFCPLRTEKTFANTPHRFPRRRQPPLLPRSVLFQRKRPRSHRRYPLRFL